MEMEIAYQDWFSCLFLLAFTPLLRTKKYQIDCTTFYLWIFTALISTLSFFYADYKFNLQVSIENQANHFLVLLLLFVLFLKLKISQRRITSFLRVLANIQLILSLILIPFSQEWLSGLIPNKGMNGIFTVMLLPYLGSNLLLLDFLLTGIVVVFSHSSCAALSFLTACTVCYLSKKRKREWVKLFLFILAGVLVSYLLIPSLFDPGDRFTRYAQFFQDFGTRDYLLGRGPGSFIILSSKLLNAKLGMDTNYYLYTHSDILQYIYEFGFIGVVPLLISAKFVTKYADWKELMALCAMISGSLFYYPFHFYPHLAVLFCIVKIVDINYSSKRSTKDNILMRKLLDNH